VVVGIAARSQQPMLPSGGCNSEPMAELAVVIPTYNERENVEHVLASLRAALSGIEWRVIFVDDNSPDGTADVLHRLAKENPRICVRERPVRLGLSSACIDGMMTASSPYIAVMDADLQHDERILSEMLSRLKGEDVDVVVASRTIPGGSMGDLPLARVWLSNVGKMLGRLVCRCDISDAMSGFFVIRREFFQRVVNRLTGKGFKLLVDLLASSVVPVRILEVPYRFRGRQRGTSKLSTGVELQFLYLVAAKAIRKSISTLFMLFE